MPIYQCPAAADMLTGAMRAQIAAAITDAHVEATGAPRVFVQVLTAADCARADEHHRRPDANNAARMGATTVEVPTNHVAMVSHPRDVLALIQAAAQAVQAGRGP